MAEPAPHPERMAQLADGSLDAVIALADFEVPAGVRMRELFRDRFVCMLRREGMRSTRLSLATYVKRHHVLVAPRGQPGSLADDALAKLGIRRHVSFVVPSFAAAALLVARSDLIATVPSRVVATWPRDVRAVACPFELRDLRFCAYAHARADADQGLQWVLDQVAAACATEGRLGT